MTTRNTSNSNNNNNNNSGTRMLSESELHRIQSTLRGLSSSSSSGNQTESNLKILLHFVEGDPWVCNAIVKQTEAVTQLFQVLDGNGPTGIMHSGGSSAGAAATALEILGILAMRTQSSRVAAPFCRLEGMRVLVRQLNYCDPMTDIALATFLEQLFCGSESEPAKSVAGIVGLIQKIVDRMSSASSEIATPLSISAFARVFVVAAQWHVPKKQAEAHYAIDAFFRISDCNIPALVNEREEQFATTAGGSDFDVGVENHQQNMNNNNNHNTAHLSLGVVVKTDEEESPVAHCFSHVLRCLVVLVSNNQDNATSACADRNLSILARLVSVVAKDSAPSRLIATLLWFVYSLADISPRLEDAVRNCLSYGYQIGCTADVNNNNNNSNNSNQQQQQQQTNSRPPSAPSNNSGRVASSASSPYYCIIGESNAWSNSLAPFRKFAASISTHLEIIRREHLRPDVVADALREICNSIFIQQQQSSSSASRALSRFVMGSPFIIKCLLLPVANVDEELVIRACQLLSFGVEGNPSAARSFFFLGGVLTLKDILDDYNPQILYTALHLTQHLAHQDAWVMRELAERGVISRILHMMIEEVQQLQRGDNDTENFSSLTSSRSHQAECVANSAMTNEPMMTALVASSSSGAGVTSNNNANNNNNNISRETLATTLLQTGLVIFRSHHITTDICTVLFHQGKTFSGYLWTPLEDWIRNACSILGTTTQLQRQQNPKHLMYEQLFSSVLDTASSLMRSILFTYDPTTTTTTAANNIKMSSPSSKTNNNNNNNPMMMSSTKSQALFSMEIKMKNISETASLVSQKFLKPVFTTPNSPSLFPVDSSQVVSSLHFLASCCAVDAISGQTDNMNNNNNQSSSSCCCCRMQLIKQDQTINTISSFISGPPGNGRVSAWTLLSALCSRLPEAQQILAENTMIVSAMENAIRGVSTTTTSSSRRNSAPNSGRNNNNSSDGSLNNTSSSCSQQQQQQPIDQLDRVQTIPRASGRPRSASSPFNQSMSLLHRVLECADHIFQAKSKEYGYSFALDVGKILAHQNSSMDVRRASLDVLQGMFVAATSANSNAVTPRSSRITPRTNNTTNTNTNNSGCESSSGGVNVVDDTMITTNIPSIVPHIVQLLLLCEETEDTEAVTMVANRAFKLFTSLPAQQTMSTIFKIAKDALQKMNISISALVSDDNNNNNNNSAAAVPPQLCWPWSPIPAPNGADEAHDLMVGLLPLINGLLHQGSSFCEVLYTDVNAWSFFFVLADAQDLQLGLRVLSLIAFGNMISRVRTPQTISIFFDDKNNNLQEQFTRTLSRMMMMRSSLDNIVVMNNHNNNNNNSTISSSLKMLLEARQKHRADVVVQQKVEEEKEEEEYLPDEALETIFFILDRISMFGKKLQARSFFFTPNNDNNNNNNTSTVLLDSLFCACFIHNHQNNSNNNGDNENAIAQSARSLLYYIFQSEDAASQLASSEQLSRLKVTLSAIVEEMNSNQQQKASATDSRRQAEAILKMMNEKK